ncbi:MAG: class I SAM-dependent methyltransferase [Candidatus Promineifilaceae bacterium]|nr:class I SAM-dependent methyltransferase [Candidatus Promineifilaceae bacterium]
MKEKGFFESGSPYLDHPLLTAERTRLEIDLIESQWDLPLGARVLDVGCGFGRHSIELARRGYVVCGIDPSMAMIAAARTKAEKAAVDIDFRQVRGQDFASEAVFDAAVCLFTTLGQIEAGEDNSALLKQVGQALKPAGYLVIEVPQRDTAVKMLRASERFGDGDVYTSITRRYDPDSQTVTEHFRVVNIGRVTLFVLKYRLYSRDELKWFLIASGFAVIAELGNYHGEPLDPDHSVMLMVAQKESI